MAQSLLRGHRQVSYVHNATGKSRSFLSSALNPITQAMIHQRFRGCHKIPTQWQETWKFWKTRTFPQCADSEHLDFSKLQMLGILSVSSKAGATQAGLAPKHPLSSSTCSWDCRISRALPQWVHSPGQSAAISLMSSLPHQRITSKSIFWREDPSRQRGTGVQWHLLQWQTSLSASMHAASYGLRMWPSLTTDRSWQPHGEWCLPGPCRGQVQTAPSFCTFARPWLTSGSPEV